MHCFRPKYNKAETAEEKRLLSVDKSKMNVGFVRQVRQGSRLEGLCSSY